jgi:hypothetical protein
MNTKHAGPWLLTVVSLFLADQAQAFTCVDQYDLPEEIGENTPTIEEILRYRSKEIADTAAQTNEDRIVVIGRFTRNEPILFLHEEQLDGIRALYWPPTDDVVMPSRIEYTYNDAYSFEGHKIENAKLVPFSADALNVRVFITSEYEGLVDVLPETDREVIGTLHRDRYDARTFELSISFCPTYFQIEPAQVSDLLECYSSGSCQ